MTRVRGLIARLVRCILPLLAVTAAPSPAATVKSHAQASPLKLERVVMLVRHGVRPPTTEPALPDGYSQQAWPGWDVPAGHLTPHGARLIGMLAAFDRQQYARRGLIAATGCPTPGMVSIWADSDERTSKSGDAWIEGFAPGCGLKSGHLVGQRDPLYSPIRVHRVDYDPALAKADADTHTGAPLAAIVAAERPVLAKVQHALDCCSVDLCKANNLKPDCTLLDFPTTITGGTGDHAHLDGQLALGSVAAENFMLEYAEGKPLADVAWGRLSKADLTEILTLHALEYRLVSRTPYVAARAAAALARRMLSALKGETDGASAVVVFLGHDDNISALGGMLDLHWHPPGYIADDPLPGTTLGFELLKDVQTGRRYVQPFIQMQSLDQMRNATPLTRADPPARMPLDFPACGAAHRPCPIEQFEALVQARAVALQPLPDTAAKPAS